MDLFKLMRDLCGNNIDRTMTIAWVFTLIWLKDKQTISMKMEKDKLVHKKLQVKSQSKNNKNFLNKKQTRQEDKLKLHFQHHLKSLHKLLFQRMRRKNKCSKISRTLRTIKKMIKQLQILVKCSNLTKKLTKKFKTKLTEQPENKSTN